MTQPDRVEGFMHTNQKGPRAAQQIQQRAAPATGPGVRGSRSPPAYLWNRRLAPDQALSRIFARRRI